VFVVTFVGALLRGLDVTLPAQADITEADLAAASGGRILRIGSTGDGHVTLIPLEAYVSRVLAGEGDPRAADAAQQALAIAIRTYTLKNRDRHARDGYDLCDSTHCQVPRPSTPVSRRAAMATIGQVLTYRGDLAEVFYSASCGGRSERAADVWPGADYPYLVSRRDDVCEDDPEGRNQAHEQPPKATRCVREGGRRLRATEERRCRVPHEGAGEVHESPDVAAGSRGEAHVAARGRDIAGRRDGTRARLADRALCVNIAG